MSNQKIKKIALCEHRHNIPGVTGSIYPHTIKFTDLHELNEIADRFVCQCKCDGYDLHVYVTGIQYPMVAIINACLRRNVSLTLWHWDPTREEYYPQKLFQVFQG